MTEIVVATTNQGKLREIRELLKDLSFKITSLADYPQIGPIEETGRSFKENALIKATTVAKRLNKLTLGEDSGLEVKFLNDRPGIYSARYSGPTATDRKNNLKLLRELRGVPMAKRQARYRCVAVLVDGNKIISAVSGTCAGAIMTRPSGKNGFGFDPLFLIPKYKKTFGELPSEIKAKISHRAKALKKLRKVLEVYLEFTA